MAREIRGIARPGGEAIYRPPPDATASGAPDTEGAPLARAARISTAAAQASLDDDGFALETQVLEQLVRKWGDFADHYREAIRAARDIASAQEPGLDFASVGHAEKVRASGAELQLALEERLGYCVDMRDRLRAALGGYVGAEDEAAAETARMGALE